MMRDRTKSSPFLVSDFFGMKSQFQGLESEEGNQWQPGFFSVPCNLYVFLPLGQPNLDETLFTDFQDKSLTGFDQCP